MKDHDINHSAVRLLSRAYPFTRWQEEVRTLSGHVPERQLDAAVRTVNSECSEPVGRFLSELAQWRSADEHGLKSAEVRAESIDQAFAALNRGFGIQVRENPERARWERRPDEYDAEEPRYIEVRVDFDDDVNLQNPSDWTYCFAFWLRSYVIDYDRWPPENRLSGFRRFARIFGAKTTIEVLHHVEQAQLLRANPEVFPRVALELSGREVERLVYRKTLDWNDPEDLSAPPPQAVTLQHIKAEWDSLHDTLLGRYEDGELINPRPRTTDADEVDGGRPGGCLYTGRVEHAQMCRL